MYGSTAVELFYKIRSTNRSTSTLLCMVVLQWSSSIKRGALIRVYLVMCGSTAEVFYVTWSTDRSIIYLAVELFYKRRSTDRSISTLLCVV